VQQGEFIDFVFLFIHQTKLRRDKKYPKGKQSKQRNQSSVRGFFYGKCISSNTEASELAET